MWDKMPSCPTIKGQSPWEIRTRNRKPIYIVLILAISAIAAVVIGCTQTSQNRPAASLVGVWKGYFPDVPAVELTLKIQEGKLAGWAVFYKVLNTGAGGEIKGKAEAPLTDPVFDGQVLSFQIKRPDDGSFYKGHVKFVAENEAILSSDSPDTSDNPPMTLRRRAIAR